MNDHRLSLHLLDRHATLTSDDPRWLETFRAYWGDFISNESTIDSPDIPVRIERCDQGWKLNVADNPTRVSSEPWQVLLISRLQLVEAAVVGNAAYVAAHASAVASEDDCLIMSGPAETGKTTLMLGLLDEGWSYVSDDICIFETSTGSVIPFPCPIGLQGERAKAKSHAAPGAEWLGPGSYLLSAASFPVSSRDSIRPIRVLFPRFLPGSKPRITYLSSAETVARLAGHAYSVNPRMLAALQQACSGRKGVDLIYPSTDRALELLGGCLGGHDM